MIIDIILYIIDYRHSKNVTVTTVTIHKQLNDISYN